LLGEATGIPASDIAEVGDFTRHPDLVDKVILVDGIAARQAMRWGLFVRALASEKIAQSIIGPIVVIFSPPGLSVEEKRTIRGGAFSCSTWGKVDRHDAVAHLARIGIRPSSDLASRIGHAVIVDVAAWSRPMLEQMAPWKVNDQIEPLALLANLAEQSAIPYPSWENGLLDLWDDEPAAHPIAAVAHKFGAHIQRRIWSAQSAIILPFADRIRRGIVQRHRDRLDQYVSPATPFKRLINDREIVKTSPDTLEFYEINLLLDRVLSVAEKNLIKIARHARDFCAHMKPMSSDFVHQLSDYFEFNREVIKPDFPELEHGA
jgi:hypothetical protein